jgi:multiple sugar transport system substrate-binding protein
MIAIRQTRSRVARATRWWAWILLLLVLLSPAALAKVQVTMGWLPTTSVEPLIGPFVADFEARHPDIDIEIVKEDSPEKVLVLEAAGTPHDIWYVRGTYAQQYIQLGILEPLDLFIQRSNYDIQDFLPVAIEAYKDSAGRLYSLPFDFAPLFMFTNVDHLNESGVDPQVFRDWTYTDMLQVARKLTRVTDNTTTRFGVMPVGWVGWLIEGTYLTPWGATLFDANETTTTLHTLEAQNALRWWQEAWRDPAMDSAFTSYFPNQNVSLKMGGAWEIGFYNSLPNFNYGIAALPRGPVARTTAVQGSGFSISKQSKNKEAAWLFMMELLGQKGMQEIWAPTTLPSRASALPQFIELALKGKYRDELYESVKMGVLGRPIQPPGEELFVKITGGHFSEFLSGKISPVELAELIATAFKGIKQ